MGWTTIATDDFNRANGYAGANWTEVVPNLNDALYIKSNAARSTGSPGSGLQCASIYTGTVPTLDDMRCQAYHANTIYTSSRQVRMYIRYRNESSGNGYFSLMTDNGSINRLYKTVSGTYTQLSTDGTSGNAGPLYLRLGIVVDNLKQEQSSDGTSYSSRGSSDITDATFGTGGSGGLCTQEHNDNSYFDDFILQEYSASVPVPLMFHNYQTQRGY